LGIRKPGKQERNAGIIEEWNGGMVKEWTEETGGI
jgi:hypothetical protein